MRQNPVAPGIRWWGGRGGAAGPDQQCLPLAQIDAFTITAPFIGGTDEIPIPVLLTPRDRRLCPTAISATGRHGASPGRHSATPGPARSAADPAKYFYRFFSV